eukprot:10140-Heterococcus_DN1.PRE.2
MGSAKHRPIRILNHLALPARVQQQHSVRGCFKYAQVVGLLRRRNNKISSFHSANLCRRCGVLQNVFARIARKEGESKRVFASVGPFRDPSSSNSQSLQPLSFAASAPAEVADIIYEDDQFIAFRDSQPASQVHLLVVPKSGAVRDPTHLSTKHIEMLEAMVTVGRQLIREEARLTNNQQRTQRTQCHAHAAARAQH